MAFLIGGHDARHTFRLDADHVQERSNGSNLFSGEIKWVKPLFGHGKALHRSESLVGEKPSNGSGLLKTI